MEPLEPPDSHYLSAAIGWCELGNWREAEEELKKINPALHARPDVLLAQYGIEAAAGNWVAAEKTGERLVNQADFEPQTWISWAYAKRRSAEGGIGRAREILIQAWQRFPAEPIIAYNLACYECQSGHLEEARTWLDKARQAGDPALIKQMALQDPDLEALRAHLEEL